jgi:putative hydrolase of the HAD superfamily
MISVVAFDIDDTLYLERDYVRSGFAAAGEWAATHLGISDLPDRAWAAFVAGRRRTIFDDVLTRCGITPTPEVIAALVETYRAHDPAIELLPDAKACLDAIESPLIAAVITDGPLVSQRTKTTALGLERWADPIVFTDELGPEWGKPSTRAFALVQEKVGAGTGSCVYVADNPAKDFSGPHELGWATVRVRRPMGLHHDRPSGPDVAFEVADLTELLERLERLER